MQLQDYIRDINELHKKASELNDEIMFINGLISQEKDIYNYVNPEDYDNDEKRKHKEA